jgi:hypothetical protein
MSVLTLHESSWTNAVVNWSELYFHTQPKLINAGVLLTVRRI